MLQTKGDTEKENVDKLKNDHKEMEEKMDKLEEKLGRKLEKLEEEVTQFAGPSVHLSSVPSIDWSTDRRMITFSLPITRHTIAADQATYHAQFMPMNSLNMGKEVAKRWMASNNRFDNSSFANGKSANKELAIAKVPFKVPFQGVLRLGHANRSFGVRNLPQHPEGGHLNPAVSLAFASLGKLPFAHFLLYSLIQTVGAFFGSALCFHLYRDNLSRNSTRAFERWEGPAERAQFSVPFRTNTSDITQRLWMKLLALRCSSFSSTR
ncbi:hypothetical protein niasHT_018019 [Heterodera trifolii]|uniref:Uncharacterized protein n=1 Tax=Heterodera trifolii TaxID=157864 RepID=A0ABD2L8U1_9BILA